MPDPLVGSIIALVIFCACVAAAVYVAGVWAVRHLHRCPEVVDPDVLRDWCWFHGIEPITDAHYRVCGECGHAWQREELEAADAEHYPDLSPRRAQEIASCPLCVHDF